jgi:single-strand DNA-binding protein
LINKVILVGRLGSDPELRETNNGTPVANFNLATDETYTSNGEKQKKTEWHKLVLWDKLASIAEQYLHKGDLVYVEGKIQSRQYEDKRDGAKHTVTEIVVFTLKMLQTQRSDQQESRPARRNQQSAKPQIRQRVQEEEIYDEDETAAF